MVIPKHFWRVWHWFLGHPDLMGVTETHAYSEDLIAHTGYVVYSGWCPLCMKTYSCKEDHIWE